MIFTNKHATAVTLVCFAIIIWIKYAPKLHKRARKACFLLILVHVLLVSSLYF